MNIVVFTFSGTGNTWWTVHTFKELAQEQDLHVEIHSIEQVKDETPSFFIDILKRTDIIGIAYPIYGSTWPHIVRDFTFRLLRIYETHHLPKQKTLPTVLVLTSMMLFSGDGALPPRKYFSKQGFHLKWAINIPLTSNISIPIFKANPYSKEKIEKNKQKAIPKLEKLLKNIILDEPWLEHQYNLPYRFIAGIQRIIGPLLYRIFQFSVDQKRCIQCNQCIRYCPTESITFNESEGITISNDACTFCMRCYNLCPVYAIKTGKKVSLPPKYKRLEPIMKDFSYSDLHKEQKESP